MKTSRRSAVLAASEVVSLLHVGWSFFQKSEFLIRVKLARRYDSLTLCFIHVRSNKVLRSFLSLDSLPSPPSLIFSSLELIDAAGLDL